MKQEYLEYVKKFDKRDEQEHWRLKKLVTDSCFIYRDPNQRE
jgi:hypothetical protein